MSLNTILATAPLTATGYHLKATGTALGQSLIWDNGTNVGIGNTNITYTLDVTGSGRYNNASAMALTVNGGTFTQATASSYSLGIGNLGGSDLTLGTSTTAGVIQTWSSKPLSLNPQGNNVLIGSTTDSSYKLDVTGTVRFSTTLLVSGAATFSNDVTIGNRLSVGGLTPANVIDAYGGSSGSSARIKLLHAYSGASIQLYTGVTDGQGIIAGAFPFWFDINGTERMRITSGGNVLIGTTTDSSYKLAVASGHQYLGTGFQITGTFGQVDRQCATAFADFSGPTVTFDLASIFPRTTFTNRGLSVTMQLVALPTYTIVSSAFVVLGRTGNSNVWSSAILANININGAVINSISATGTVITIVYNTHIFGTAYINLATIG